MDGVEQQLEYISDSIGSIDSSLQEFSQNYNNGGSSSGIGLIIVVVLLCINSNIKKLTQAIRGKNSYKL